MPHQESSLKVIGTDMVEATVTSRKVCTVCNTVTHLQTVPLQAIHDGEYFLFSPSDFTARLGNMLDGISGNVLTTKAGSIDGEFACGILLGEKRIGAFMMIHDNEYILANQRYDACFSQLLGMIEDTDNYVRVILALIETCDPSLSFYEARDLGSDLIDSGSVTHNGITYVLYEKNNEAMIGVTIE